MKKNILTIIGLFLFGITSFSQKKNGTIYITHPNIDAVNKGNEAYLQKDEAGSIQFFSDTAKAWMSGMEKPIPIKEAAKMWMSDFDYYDSIKLKPNGYPDYLEYDKDNSKVVQSWWTWSGKSKKTGELVKIPVAQFDFFDNKGKITFEGIYGDFSKMKKE